MITIKLSEYAQDIEDAMIRHTDAYRTETPEGLLEFSINYSDEYVKVYTGVEFLGAREHYLRPADVNVGEVNLYRKDDKIIKPNVVSDYEFNAEKIYS